MTGAAAALVENGYTKWEPTSTWVDRSGRDRAEAIIGHEFAGVVAALGDGTTGLLGERVFGITDWHRDGTLAVYTAEARNLAPLPDRGDVGQWPCKSRALGSP